MCTVVIRVPEPGAGPVRVLAIRDEDPVRAWRPLGSWWPELPQVRGIQDELAGGAWLAVDDRRLAVLVNRAGGADVARLTSRGHLVLDAVLDEPLPEPLTTLGFNLVVADADGVSVTQWEGGSPERVRLAPGTHMVSHGDLDDPGTPRIAAWLPVFGSTETAGTTPWWDPWLEVLAESARLGPTDPRAIIRDNRPEGYPTLSLLVAAISIGSAADGGVHAVMDVLDEPGVWNKLRLR